MTSKEATIYQLKQLKGKPLKDKIVHVLTYYWLPIVAVLAAVLLIILQAVSMMSQRENVLSIICVNSLLGSGSIESYGAELESFLNIDIEEQQISFDTGITFSETDTIATYQGMQKLMALVATQEADVISGDINTILQLAYSEYFCDISTIFSESQMESYSDYIIYIDKALLQNVDQVNGTFEYPDFWKPDKMIEPMPIAIKIPEASSYAQMFYQNRGSELCAGIVINSDNASTVADFFEYVIE